MDYHFTFDKRLGIKIPQLELEWTEYNKITQETILDKWEKIRGHIPDRIKEIEEEINQKQAALYDEDNFEKSCELNTNIADLASVINDLWLWYRVNQTISSNKTHQ